VIHPGGGETLFHDITEVTFRTLDDATISHYFSQVNPLDKAGAYGIQECGDLIISEIRGSYENVMGLPVKKLLDVLG
jgi:septum formation protein